MFFPVFPQDPRQSRGKQENSGPGGAGSRPRPATDCRGIGQRMSDTRTTPKNRPGKPGESRARGRTSDVRPQTPAKSTRPRPGETTPATGRGKIGRASPAGRLGALSGVGGTPPRAKLMTAKKILMIFSFLQKCFSTISTNSNFAKKEITCFFRSTYLFFLLSSCGDCGEELLHNPLHKERIVGKWLILSLFCKNEKNDWSSRLFLLSRK